MTVSTKPAWQRPNWGDGDLLSPVVLHQADRVATAGVERGDERLVYIDKDHVVARFGKELAQEAPPHVPRAEHER